MIGETNDRKLSGADSRDRVLKAFAHSLQHTLAATMHDKTYIGGRVFQETADEGVEAEVWRRVERPVFMV